MRVIYANSGLSIARKFLRSLVAYATYFLNHLPRNSETLHPAKITEENNCTLRLFSNNVPKLLAVTHSVKQHDEAAHLCTLRHETDM
mmetsp:Transcript_2053/g.2749  ORF Transcript_2053/g.2749 Transcript_2053/m.2749 type:complete len:87 (+) Transcript_2053:823-1083(+)